MSSKFKKALRNVVEYLLEDEERFQKEFPSPGNIVHDVRVLERACQDIGTGEIVLIGSEVLRECLDLTDFADEIDMKDADDALFRRFFGDFAGRPASRFLFSLLC
jgi:hypothetical protein